MSPKEGLKFVIFVRFFGTFYFFLHLHIICIKKQKLVKKKVRYEFNYTLFIFFFFFAGKSVTVERPANYYAVKLTPHPNTNPLFWPDRVS